MKNILLTLVFLVCFGMSIEAQTNTASDYAANYKQQQLELLQKSGISLTNVQADSVVAINYDIAQQVRSLKGQSETDLKNSMQSLEAYRMQRLTSALQSQSLAQQVVSYFKKVRMKMYHRNMN